MGWFVGPINGIPAIHHQGETFNFHANMVLVPGSRTGVIVLMNAENSLDLFLNGRMGTISEGVTSLLEGRDPAPPPSNHPRSSLYAALFALLALQLRGIVRWIALCGAATFQSGRLGSGSAHRALARPKPRLGSPRLSARAEAARLVALRRRSGTSRSRLRPSAQRTRRALWGIVRTIWAYATLERRPAVTAIPRPQRPAPSRASHEHARLSTPGARIHPQARALLETWAAAPPGVPLERLTATQARSDDRAILDLQATPIDLYAVDDIELKRLPAR